MNVNILPVIRTDKTDASGLAPIYLFLYNPKLNSKVSIGQKIDPSFWDSEARRVKKKAPNATLINSLIERKISDLNAEILLQQLTVKAVNLKLLKKQPEAPKKEVDFYEFVEKQITEKNYSPDTRRGYRCKISKMKCFRKSLKISEINFDFLQAYEAYMRNELKNSHNTIWNNFKFINTFTNDAIKFGYIFGSDDPFKTFRRPRYKQTKRTFLTVEEIAAVETYIQTVNDKEVEAVGKYFLFMCNTGLRISDALVFQSALHVVNNERIVIKTQKTEQETNLYINDKIRPLIDYIDANRLKMPQSTFNSNLQYIAAQCGIKKKITAHVARHSFGSVLVDLGVDMSIAQKLLAHGSIESTKVYYHLKNANMDDAMKKFNKAV